MADVAANDQGFIEEYAFSLLRRDSMAFPVLVRVSFIPFEPGASIERIVVFRHITSISLTYTVRKSKSVSLTGLLR